uniref:Coiled-coil domain-containing protein 82 n=1 Tax=Callorhinchus milii TaxID=7868 RepID=V9KUH9_CALMI
METAVAMYQTRARRAQGLLKSRIDRRRTKMYSASCLRDTDEEENTSDEEQSSRDEGVQSSDSNDDSKQVQNPVATIQSSDEDNINRSKRLRTSSNNVFSDSDSSSGSEIWSKPVRKIKNNSRRVFVQEGEEDSDKEGTSATNLSVGTEDFSQIKKEISIARKRKRHLEMKRLSKERRSRHSNSGIRNFSEESDEEGGASSVYEVGSSDSDFEKSSLKDFIVEDDDEEEESEEETQSGENHTSTPKKPESSKSILAKYLPNFRNDSPYTHFKRVVKGLLINALDGNFLKSLYDGARKKKYAKEILSSLNYMDDRCIKPRLVNLKTTSRWSNRYQERIDCYPTLQVKQYPAIQRSCQACKLKRTCRFTVILSGLLYNGKSLQEDNFMPNDEQRMKVGNVCKERTEIYHSLKHFKYNLYQKCCETVQSDTHPDEQAKDTIDRLYKCLDEHQWIEEEYKHFEYVLNNADDFRKEKLFE